MSNESKLMEVPESTQLARKLEIEYVAEIRGMSKEELDDKMLGLAMEEQAIVTTKKADEKLEASIQNTKMLNEPYREQLKMNKIRKRFVSLVIEELKK